MTKTQKVELIKSKILELVRRYRLTPEKRFELIERFVNKEFYHKEKWKCGTTSYCLVTYVELIIALQSCKWFESDFDELDIVHFCIAYASKNR